MVQLVGSPFGWTIMSPPPCAIGAFGGNGEGGGTGVGGTGAGAGNDSEPSPAGAARADSDDDDDDTANDASRNEELDGNLMENDSSGGNSG